MNPRVFEWRTRQYKNLEAVAKMLEALSPNEAIYEVENVFFDFGQNWMWTTIVRYRHMECQVLTPKEWNEVISAETVEDLANAVNDIRNGDWFGDK